MVGNPPWDVSELIEIEFFANLLPEIAVLNGNDRKIAIERLKKEKPQIYELFEIRKHALESENTYYGNSGRFPLTSYGKVNLYSKFAELNCNLRNISGSTGFVCPSGIATDDSTKVFFGKIVTNRELRSLYDFENKEGIFPNVHKMYKFCLLTIFQGDVSSDFVFFLKNISELEDKRRHFTMTPEDFELINPNTRTCPVFRSVADAELAKKIYHKAGVFVKESPNNEALYNGNPWHVSFQQMYNMASASSRFIKQNSVESVSNSVYPLYEGKFISLMDHRWATYQDVLLKNYKEDPRDSSDNEKANVLFRIKPRYYVPYEETILRLTRLDKSIVSNYRKALSNDSAALDKLRSSLLEMAAGELSEALRDTYFRIANSIDMLADTFELAKQRCPRYLMGWRDVTNALNSRTQIVSVFPIAGVGDTLPLFHFETSITTPLRACFLGNMNALVLDFIARLKIGGVHMKQFSVKQLAVLPPTAYTETAINFIVPRVFALTYTATDIVEWARALWNDASVDLRKLILAQHKDLPTGTDIETLAASDFDPATIPPIVFEDTHRAKLRAELDAYFARLYSLSRRDLEYILDPKAVMGDDYPSETFRVLRDAEFSTYGEYRTQRLVLEAWDKMN